MPSKYRRWIKINAFDDELFYTKYIGCPLIMFSLIRRFSHSRCKLFMFNRSFLEMGKELELVFYNLKCIIDNTYSM